MSENTTLTQRWLRQNTHVYSNRDVVYSHVDALLATHPTLRPKTDIYTYDDGRSQLMLCIHGLLPITYRRASYNIPVAVWLTHNYPTEPPLVYVVPTSDMLIKASKHVEVSGRCEAPYIHDWLKKSEGCNLSSLVEALADQFSREPPVYARPRAASPPPTLPQSHDPTRSLSQPDYATRPPPQPGQPPTVPLLRPFTQSPPVVQPPHVQQPPLYQSPQPRTSSATYHPSPPVPPPRPQLSPSQRQSFPTQPHQKYESPSSQQQYASPPLPVPHLQQYTSSPPKHYAPQQYTSPPQHHAPHQYTSPSPHQYASPPPHQHAPPPPQSNAPPPPPPQHNIPPPLPVFNLLDEDPSSSTLAPIPTSSTPPPRPPNPEILRLHTTIHSKLSQSLDHLATSLASDTTRLQTAQADLLAGEPAIRDEMARLQAVRDVCRVVGTKMGETVRRAEIAVDEIKRKGDPEVDELICGTTIVYNQLVDLVAEDNAIEDTIYHLHRALNAGRIDLDKFLRTMRSLAEEQFMKRALAEKVVASIPMGAWS